LVNRISPQTIWFTVNLIIRSHQYIVAIIVAIDEYNYHDATRKCSWE